MRIWICALPGESLSVLLRDGIDASQEGVQPQEGLVVKSRRRQPVQASSG